jgi:hypothetical protein
MIIAKIRGYCLIIRLKNPEKPIPTYATIDPE